MATAAIPFQLPPPPCRDGPLLVVVEGANDVRLLKRLSVLLRQDDPSVLDLENLEVQGTLVFIPFGGGNVLAWCDRLAPLGCPEVHILDRKIPPETDLRRIAVDRINARPRCWARLTRLPTAEHYLLGTLAEIHGTFASPLPALMPACVASTWYAKRDDPSAWEQLSARQRRRYVHRAKSWLYSHVLPRMTLDHLHAVDPHGEVAGWFAAMATLIGN